MNGNIEFRPEQSMRDKLVLITGASSGIGKETARQFARLGAIVLVLARNRERLAEMANEIRLMGGRAEEFVLDLADLDALIATAERIKVKFGIPDVIVNNAGAGKWRFLEEMEYGEARDMMMVPYLAALYLTKAFMPEMLKRNSGHIVTVTSFAAKIPFAGATSYIASRKALLGLHEALSYDLHGTGIRTSLAYFAKVDSPLWEHNPGSEERLPKVQRLIKVISAERAAQAIVDGVVKNRREMYAPFTLKVILFLTWLTPAITRFIMNTTGYKRSRKVGRQIA